MSRFEPELFFDLQGISFSELFSKKEPVWNALKSLKGFLDGLSYPTLYNKWDVVIENPERVMIGEGTVIEPGVVIQGPCVIGKNCIIRQGAYLRPYVLTGNHCIIGHASEVKHSILLNHASAPHFNYIGDSILGNHTNIGAGAICSNYRLDGKNVRVEGEDTGLKKFGAIVGDGASVGCNCVLNPGVILGRDQCVLPCQSVKGVLIDAENPL